MAGRRRRGARRGQTVRRAGLVQREPVANPNPGARRLGTGRRHIVQGPAVGQNTRARVGMPEARARPVGPAAVQRRRPDGNG